MIYLRFRWEQHVAADARTADEWTHHILQDQTAARARRLEEVAHLASIVEAQQNYNVVSMHIHTVVKDALTKASTCKLAGVVGNNQVVSFRLHKYHTGYGIGIRIVLCYISGVHGCMHEATPDECITVVHKRL